MNEAAYHALTTNATPAASTWRSVAIVQRVVTDYNVPLFNGLLERLGDDRINLSIIAGDDGNRNHLRESLNQVTNAVRVRNIRLGKKLYWQPVLSRLKSFDLIIIEQSNAALVNYPLIWRRHRKLGPKIAYWGHGRTFSPSDTGPLRAAWKRGMTNLVDHFFAYTDLSARTVMASGVSPDKITVVNNSLDTSQNTAARLAMNAERRARVRSEFGLPSGPVAIFCSRLLEGRQLPFLLDACRLSRDRVPDLQIVVIGDGEKYDWLSREAANTPWLHPMGALYGEPKANLLAASDLFVMPAQMGLSILEAFSAGLPVVCANFSGHGPEVEYLVHGENGLTTQTNREAFADAIVSIAGNETNKLKLAGEAVETARRYSLTKSIARFAQGINSVLGVNRV